MWKYQTISIYLKTKNSPRNVNPEIIKHFLTMFQYLAQETNTSDKKNLLLTPAAEKHYF